MNVYLILISGIVLAIIGLYGVLKFESTIGALIGILSLCVVGSISIFILQYSALLYLVAPCILFGHGVSILVSLASDRLYSEYSRAFQAWLIVCDASILIVIFSCVYQVFNEDKFLLTASREPDALKNWFNLLAPFLLAVFCCIYFYILRKCNKARVKFYRLAHGIPVKLNLNTRLTESINCVFREKILTSKNRGQVLQMITEMSTIEKELNDLIGDAAVQNYRRLQKLLRHDLAIAENELLTAKKVRHWINYRRMDYRYVTAYDIANRVELACLESIDEDRSLGAFIRRLELPNSRMVCPEGILTEIPSV